MSASATPAPAPRDNPWTGMPRGSRARATASPAGQRRESGDRDGRKVVLAIAGMKCNACRERIIEALGRLPGVRETSVSLIRARAVVVLAAPCTPEEVIQAVSAAGYSATIEPAPGPRPPHNPGP